MLLILRQLRRLEVHKRSGRYIIYAFGEIVLIVVGILIALEINNWNDNRKPQQERRDLIENLKTDFQGNLINLVDTLKETDEIMGRFKQFLIDILDDEKLLTVDEIKRMNVYALRGMGYRPQLGAYQTAIASGSIGLIKDPVLNELIRRFEEESESFQSHNETGREVFFSGGVLELRNRLGSLAGFHPEEVPVTELFTYSAEYYKEFFKKKEVYSTYENLYVLKLIRQENLVTLKELSEEILAALEAL